MDQTDTSKMYGDCKKQKLNSGHFWGFRNPIPDLFLNFPQRGCILEKEDAYNNMVNSDNVALLALAGQLMLRN